MAKILIVEPDPEMRVDLMTLDTPFELFVVASADEAWAFVEAGLTFADVIYFEDPIAEALLRAASLGSEAELVETEQESLRAA